TSSAILAAVKLGVPEALRDGPRTSDDLARAVGADPAALRRLVRALASVGVLAQAEGRFGLTPMSRYLLADTPGSMVPLMRFAGAAWHHRAWEGLPESVRTGKPASAEVLGAPLFQYLEQNPEVSEVFNAAMRSFSAQVAAAVLEGYDFSKVARIV